MNEINDFLSSPELTNFLLFVIVVGLLVIGSMIEKWIDKHD